MKSLNEIVSGEGKINNVPKIGNISHRLLNSNISKENTVNNNKNIINNWTLNDTNILKKHFTKLKSFSSNSTISTNANNEKIKKVTFSTVSIIRIQNYKQYNKLNSYKKDDNRNYSEESESCNIF